MPTVTVSSTDVSREQAMEAVRQQFGGDYKVQPAANNAEVFSVNRGALTGAKVHIRRQGGATQFHVHGTGFIIGRVINELGIARRVAAVLSSASLG